MTRSNKTAKAQWEMGLGQHINYQYKGAKLFKTYICVNF